MNTTRGTCMVLLMLIGSCTIYAQSSWNVVGRMSGSRQYFDAYPISSNEIIAIGGFTSTMSGTGVLATSDIFNIDTREVVPGPSMSVARGGYASVVMPDGGIVVLGGAVSMAYDITNTVERFDPQTRRWSVVGRMIDFRWQHQAIPIDDHRILVVGGRLQDISVIGTCEIFDLETGTSKQIAPHPYRTSMGRLMKTKTGQILSFGGRDGNPGSNRYAEVYELDTATRTWKSHVGFPTPLYHPAILTLNDGGLFASGGAYQESNGDDELTDGLFRWDGERFDSIGRMTMKRVSHLMVQYDANTILIAGGQAFSKVPSVSCDLVNITTGEVRPGPNLNTGRSLFALVRMGTAMNPRIYALGGRMDASRFTNEIEELSGCTGGAIDMYRAGIIPAGQATIADHAVVLTDTREYARGAVWAKEKVPVARGFSTSFTFSMTGGNDNGQVDGSIPGADGIAFVVQNGGPSPIGNVGEGVGYDQLTKALVVEFDTYSNPAFGDPDGNHIAVQTGGTGVCRALHSAPYMLGMTSDVETFVPDGRVYHGRIDYQGDRLSIYMDRTGAFSRPVLMVDSVDVGRLLGLDADGMAWIGFTSATGKSVEGHMLQSWVLGDCRDVAESVDDEKTHGTSPATYIAPMPSSGVARLFSDVEFSGAITIAVNDVTGMMIGNVTVDRDDLRSGFELPFRLVPGSYYVRMTDGVGFVTVPWIVLP